MELTRGRTKINFILCKFSGNTWQRRQHQDTSGCSCPDQSEALAIIIDQSEASPGRRRGRPRSPSQWRRSRPTEGRVRRRSSSYLGPRASTPGHREIGLRQNLVFNLDGAHVVSFVVAVMGEGVL